MLSFVNLGLYWNNHHHLMHATHGVDAAVLWSNLHLLFWLSLIPFATAWMGVNHFTAWPLATYGVVLLMSGIAIFVTERRWSADRSSRPPLSCAASWKRDARSAR